MLQNKTIEAINQDLSECYRIKLEWQPECRAGRVLTFLIVCSVPFVLVKELSFQKNRCPALPGRYNFWLNHRLAISTELYITEIQTKIKIMQKNLRPGRLWSILRSWSLALSHHLLVLVRRPGHWTLDCGHLR